MAAFDTYEVRVNLSNGENLMQNVFHYLQQVGAGNATELSTTVRDTVVQAMRSILSDVVTIDTIDVKNIDNVNDIASLLVNQAGLDVGELAMDAVGVAFELIPIDLQVGKGRKIFGPVSESLISYLGVGPGDVAAINALALQMATTISDGGGNDWIQAIVSPPNLSHANRIVASLAGAVFKRVSTQNSRKPWRN